MTGATRSWHRPELTLTELNIATSARYAACLAAGSHRPGAEVTSPRVPPRYQAQNVGYLEMPICPVCQVPILPRGNTAFAKRASVPY